MMNFDANGRRIKKSLPQKLHHIHHTTPETSTFSSKFDTISDSALISFRGMIHDNKLSECETYLKELETIFK